MCPVCQAVERDEKPTGLLAVNPKPLTTPESRRAERLQARFEELRDQRFRERGSAVPASEEEAAAIEESTALSKRLAVEDRLPKHMRDKRRRRGYTPHPVRAHHFEGAA